MKPTDRLRKLLSEATPGPWYPSNDVESGAVCHVDKADGLPWAIIDCLENRADADLIVAMHEALPALLDVAEAAAKVSCYQNAASHALEAALAKLTGTDVHAPEEK